MVPAGNRGTSLELAPPSGPPADDSGRSQWSEDNSQGVRVHGGGGLPVPDVQMPQQVQRGT